MSDVADNWDAEPLPPEGRKDALKDQRSFAVRTKAILRDSNRFSWWIAGTLAVSNIVVAVSMGSALYRQKPQQTQFIVLNKMESGVAYTAVPAADAVKWFDATDRRDDVEKFVTNILGYVDVQDKEQWKTVRAMSTPACFMAYDAARKLSFAPNNKLGTNGWVELSEWQEDQHPVKASDDAWSYTIRVKTREIQGKQIQMVKDLWQVTVVFRYVPDINLDFGERHRNRRGFQCISYKADKI